MFTARERIGRLLSSPRDPDREAMDWLQRQKVTLADKLVVLGFGSGFHVKSLLSAFPEKTIICVELDKDIRAELVLRGVHKLKHLQVIDEMQLFSLADKKFQILSFRPAWQGMETGYLETYLTLNSRRADSLQRDCNEMNLRETAQALRDLDTQMPISIKTITDHKDLNWKNDSDELKMWRCLRELVV